MGIRAFKVNSQSGQIELSDSADPGIEKIVSFSSPTFKIDAGEWFTQKLTINVPEDSGFTYSFATTISRAEKPTPVEGSSSIEGSVAVFTLLSVDKPGAVRSFEVKDFFTDKKVYEYLPTNFSIKIKNTGNIIVQPNGNIFIQRNSDDEYPISTLTLNKEGGYIIPDSERTFNSSWDEGFPRFEKNANSDQSKLIWNFSDASKFRIGKYTAKLVAVYDDGERDVPIVGEVSFWIIPWKQILMIVIALLLMVFGAFYIIRGLLKSIKKRSKKNEKTPTKD